MPAPKWLSQEEERAWRSFLFVELRLHERLARAMGEASSLNYTDYMILVALTDSPSCSLRLYEISAALGWEKSRLSHHVARMADRGLVQRCEYEHDRRGATFSITEEGQAQLRAEAPHHLAAVRRWFIDLLTPEQLRALASLDETVLPALNQPAPHPRAGE